MSFRGRTALRRIALAGAVVISAGVVGAVAPWRRVPAPRRLAQPDSLVRVEEAAYARVIATLADSAIRQLDFFPAPTQLRVQMAFLDPRAAQLVPFDALAARSGMAVDVVSALGDRVDGVHAPEDLRVLHGAVASSLHEARDALARLATAAEACRGAPASVPRCQAPFTSASSELARAYKRYLAARARIGQQITDTGTQLPRFAGRTPR